MTKTFGDFFLLKKQNARPFVQRDALLLFYKNGFAVPNENRDSSIINDINILTQKQLWISH